MYLAHFRLNEAPFALTPSTRLFFGSEASQEALHTLQVAIAMGEGFMKITGEVGTGKTTLCRKLLTSLGDEYATAYVFNPYLEPLALFIELAAELGLPRPAAGISQAEVLAALTRRLLELNDAGKRVVICLDEVQAMPIQTLEALRLLTNLETDHRKLLQVIVFGQPELDAHLDHPSVRQLRQRITFHYRLRHLNRSEFFYYVHHRLSAAGYRGGPLFTPAALWLLRLSSRRIPRLINILANKAMMSAYGKGRTRVDFADMWRAVADTDAVRTDGRVRRVLLRLAALATLSGLAAGLMWRFWS